jgi:DNA-binding PucR family transcriptional regulator
LTSIGSILDVLGPPLQILRRPAQLDLPVTQVVLRDAAVTEDALPRALVLAIGTADDAASVAAVVHEAIAGQAAALVLRMSELASTAAVKAATPSDLAVIGAPAQLAWRDVFQLAEAAIAHAAAEEHHPQFAGVEPGDLFGLADAIAAMADAAVTIEDARGRLLAYSALDHPVDEARRQSILGRTWPAPWRRWMEEQGIMQRLRAEHGVVAVPNVPEEQFHPRVATAVRTGQEVLGYVWAVLADGSDERAERALSEATPTVAWHLSFRQASADVERAERTRVLHDLLSGHGDHPGARRWDGGPPYVVLVIRPVEAESWTAGEQRRVVTLVDLHARAATTNGICAVLQDDVVLVLPEARDIAMVDRVARAIATSLPALRPLAVGVSFAATSLTALPAAHRAALRACAAAAGERQVIHFDRLRARFILDEVLEWLATRPDTPSHGVLTLIEHDRKHGTQYAEAMHAFLEHGGRMRSAAAGIGIHENTLRYRLAKASSLAQIELDGSDERLLTLLELRLASAVDDRQARDAHLAVSHQPVRGRPG